MPVKLTTGAISDIMSGAKIERPVLQLLGSRKLNNNGTERYRLFLSDGGNSCTFAMLATQLNFHITSGDLDKFAIIRMDNYVLNQFPPDKKVLVVLDLVILNSGVEVGDKIGEPVNIGAQSSHDRDECLPDSTNGPKRFKASDGAEGAVIIKNEPTSNRANGPQSNAFYKPYQDSARGGGGASHPRIVHPIANLTPYQNRWTIRARITNKPPIRVYNNSRGEGKLFSVDLLDESGEIRATGFNDACDKLYNKIEVNKVYYISRGTLKPANKNYTSIRHEYELTFNNDSTIELCEDSIEEIPLVQFAFVTIKDLLTVEKNTVLDVIGVCKRSGDLQTLLARATNRELQKRDVFLVDKSNMEVAVTFWGEQAERFDGSDAPVVALKGARVSDFGGCSLSTVQGSVILVNPNIPEANELRSWYASEGCSSAISSISKGSGSGYSSTWKCLQQVKLDGLNATDKPDFMTVKATVSFVKEENCMYMACPTAECNKKVNDFNNGVYRCEKCNKEFNDFKWRLMVNISISDFSESVWITCFQESAESMLGITAAELGHLKNTDQNEFIKKLHAVNFKQFIFKLRAKMETFQDENRLKITAVSASPVSFIDYNKKLIEDLKSMV